MIYKIGKVTVRTELSNEVLYRIQPNKKEYSLEQFALSAILGLFASFTYGFILIVLVGTLVLCYRTSKELHSQGLINLAS